MSVVGSENESFEIDDFKNFKSSLKNTNYRWAALVLTIFTAYGCYYSGSMPQVLQDPFQTELNINES